MAAVHVIMTADWYESGRVRGDTCSGVIAVPDKWTDKEVFDAAQHNFCVKTGAPKDARLRITFYRAISNRAGTFDR